jgi:hypothetical protein
MQQRRKGSRLFGHVTPYPDAEPVRKAANSSAGAVRAVPSATAKWRYGHEHIQRQPNDASEGMSGA